MDIGSAQSSSDFFTIAIAAYAAVISTFVLGWDAYKWLAAGAKVDFGKEIQPIFAARCYKCHGPKKQEGGLRLDLKDRALEGGDSGLVIVPEKAGESEAKKQETGGKNHSKTKRDTSLLR